MSAITSAVSGMSAAVSQLNLSAASIANADNANTAESNKASASAAAPPPARPAYAPVQLSSVPTGSDFSSQTVSQIDAVTQFKANLKTVQTSNEMFKSLLSVSA